MSIYNFKNLSQKLQVIANSLEPCSSDRNLLYTLCPNCGCHECACNSGEEDDPFANEGSAVKDLEPLLRSEYPSGNEFVIDENNEKQYNLEYYYPEAEGLAIYRAPERSGDGYSPLIKDDYEYTGYAPNTKTRSEIMKEEKESAESIEKSINDIVDNMVYNDSMFTYHEDQLELIPNEDYEVEDPNGKVEEYVRKEYEPNTDSFAPDLWSV